MSNRETHSADASQSGAGPSVGVQGRNVLPPTTFMKVLTADSLGALTSSQKGFISSVRILESTSDLDGLQLKRAVADMFPPAVLFSKEICDLPAVHIELRNFLDSRGANLQQHSSHRVMNTLAHELYEEAEDTQAAIDMARAIIAAGRRPRADLNRQTLATTSAPVESDVSNATHSSPGKLAHNVAMRLKDRDKKFSGELGESWMEFVDEYSQISRDYAFDPPLKLQYLHNLLRGDAKRFYLDKVEGYATSFQQAVAMLEGEYNSPVRQTRVKNYLNSLRVSSFVSEGMEQSAALSKIYKSVIKLSRQGPRSHQGDAHKVEFLRNAVVGMPWSNEPLSRVATHSLTFQQLYAELEAALQLDKEASLALLRDSAERQGKSFISDTSHGIMYTGQGRYMNSQSRTTRPPWKNARSGQRGWKGGSEQTQKPKFNPLSVQGCFNCGGNHLVKDCDQQINTARAAAKKLEYFAKKKSTNPYAVHQVLADLCRQIDGDTCEVQYTSTSQNDCQVFENLISNSLEDDRSSNDDAEEQVEHDGDSTNLVYVLNNTLALDETETFLGACIDSAAQRSVIGKGQAQAYCDFANIPFRLQPNATFRVFSFGTHRHEGIGRFQIRMPIDGSHFLKFLVDVVDLQVPLLLGLDTMKAFKMVLDTARLLLSSKSQHWSVQLTNKRGHLYYDWSSEILFTESELVRVHKHFYHPNSERLYAMMKKGVPGKTSPQVLKDLEKIERTCDVCQRLGPAPHRFRVSLPDSDIVFNRTVCMDIMFLEAKPVLHVVDKDTKFSAAAFLKGETTDETWYTYMRIWVSVYVGFPDTIATDQGTQFQSQRWKSLLQMAGIKQKSSGVQSHNALGVGERYRSFLRQIYRKVRLAQPGVPAEYALLLAVKAMNDSAGPQGLVPTLLVFGIMPRIPIVPSELPDQISRMAAMHSACKEMASVIAKERLTTALRAKVPSAATKDVRIGSDVLVFRESPENQWTGPFRVLDVDGKVIHVDINGSRKQLSIDKVKCYRRLPQPEESDNAIPKRNKSPGESIQGVSNDLGQRQEGSDILNDLKRIIDDMKDSELEKALEGDPNIASDTTGMESEHAAHTESPYYDSVAPTFVTEVVESHDPRSNTPKFQKAKALEVRGLRKRKTWKVIQKTELPAKANVLGGRFVLTLKNLGSQNERAKARYVAQGNHDKEKHSMVHNVTTLRQSSTRLIISIAAIKGFRIFAHDVNQAYLQSEEELSRKLFLLPKRKDLMHFGITEDEILQLLRPIYGTTDAGDHWGVTIDKHVRDELHLEPLKGDPSLYIKPNEEDVDGVMGIYVDDAFVTGNENMQKLTEKTLRRFDSKPRQWDKFDFFGTSVTSLHPGKFSISQETYTERLRLVPLDASFEFFRSYRATFAWIGHSRPDLSCVINKAPQVTERTFCKEKIKQLNKAIKHAKKTASTGLMYHALQKASLHLRVYTDASFANNDDLSSQLGFIILLCDESNHAHILDYSSRKSKRVVRSILGGEVYAFADGFDRAFMIRRDLERIYKQQIPLHILTDSLQMFDIVTKASSTTERRLMIDIAAARESYNREEISNVGLVLTEHNIADGLTKEQPNKALEDLLKTGYDYNPVQQWIIRTQASSSFKKGECET